MICAITDAQTFCVCTFEFEPVCGENGVTYSNECFAACDNVRKYSKGKCPCVCTRGNPVCGVDGDTYSNKCVASCENVVLACEGRCPCKGKLEGGGRVGFALELNDDESLVLKEEDDMLNAKLNSLSSTNEHTYSSLLGGNIS